MENPNGARGSRISLCVRITKTTHGGRKIKTMSGGVESVHGKNGESVFSTPCDVKRESPLVEFARGQGLTVLPHPPLLSNNCPD